jgi:hypothetical protein
MSEIKVYPKTEAAVAGTMRVDPADTFVCPGCKGTMRLAGIEPHPLPGRTSQILTYECRCGQILTDTVL